ncbi:heptaprenylglyceryl phosphate synthase [Paenibacillus spiritus]|uniref:Heptaprenylglyceryl phosphate synthase n=1 Tax=Paenibacillus spiritus TaxID=2496557 RepID=A0A5J5FZU6_9BACL|nr:heptaprenylglyceryl phosphate synthase [Paenibacillus spiritus]KAA8999493.1 heptaprenylglyceryl phosphate synthase [Paenibacillus spiritus]
MTTARDRVPAWRHVFKLDPDRPIGDEELGRICTSGTDAIMVGGSTGVTYTNTSELLGRIRKYEIPCVLEVSELGAVVPGFDRYLIPMVLNSSDSAWVVGQHRQGIERYGDYMPWDLLLAEGYIVLNGDSAVARLTEADVRLDAEGAAAYAQVADKLMRLPIVYVEYSGTFGDMETVARIRESVEHAALFYGGGICGPEEARKAAAVSDTVVVGNIVYRDLEAALATVEAVRTEASAEWKN